MLTMNRATVLGYAGRNPEMRMTSAGDDVALLSLATNERFKRRDGTEGETTEWHAVVAFGTAAETVRKRVRRGDPVLVEGRMSTRVWTDRTGAERRTTEIVVSGPRGRINVLTRRKPEPGDGSPPGGAASSRTPRPVEPERTDALAAAPAPSAGVVESGAENGADDAPAQAGNVTGAQGDESDASTPQVGNAGDAKVEEVAPDAAGGGAATASGPSSEIGASAAATRSEKVERGSGETAASSADAPGSPAASGVDAAVSAGGAGAASTGPSSEKGAGPGDTGRSNDAIGPAVAAQPDGVADAEQGSALVQGNAPVQRNSPGDRHA